MLRATALLMVVTQAVPFPRLQAQELTEETFGKWCSYILPKEKELAWRKIPWRRTLWDGVREAQTKDMPLLFWAMNGHPLDCV